MSGSFHSLASAWLTANSASLPFPQCAAAAAVRAPPALPGNACQCLWLQGQQTSKTPCLEGNKLKLLVAAVLPPEPTCRACETRRARDEWKCHRPEHPRLMKASELFTASSPRCQVHLGCALKPMSNPKDLNHAGGRRVAQPLTAKAPAGAAPARELRKPLPALAAIHCGRVERSLSPPTCKAF